MNTFTVTGDVANFHAGAILKLTKAQAGARSHALESKGKSVYIVKETVHFKRGEVLGCKGEPSKAMQQVIKKNKKEVPPKTKPPEAGQDEAGSKKGNSTTADPPENNEGDK